MNSPTLTTILATILTLLSGAASFMAFMDLTRQVPHDSLKARQNVLVVAVSAGAMLTFLYRLFFAKSDWQPLESHVDGLLLIASLFGMTVLFLERRARLPGLGAFAMPLLTLLLAWSICASYWTFEIFHITSVVKTAHLIGVYLGTLFLGLAAIAGGMYLFVQGRLRDKKRLGPVLPMASLESIERVIIRSSALGFALLTFGLATGLILVLSGPNKMGAGWWYSPKVVLAFVAWLIYALVMNVRHATAFRGARAAWLSIAGILLLLSVFGIATALPPTPPAEKKEKEVVSGQRPVAGEYIVASGRWPVASGRECGTSLVAAHRSPPTSYSSSLATSSQPLATKHSAPATSSPEAPCAS